MKLSAKEIPVERFLLIILIGLIPILSTDNTLDPNLALQFIALTVLLILLWFVFRGKRTEFIIKNKTVLIFFSLFIIFIVYSVVSAVISNNPADALFFLAKYVLFFLLLCVFQFFHKPDDVFKTVSYTAIILSLIITLPGYYQVFNLIKEKELIIPSGTYKISSILPHRNLLSEMLMLILPFTAFSFFQENKYWKYIGIISFNLSLFLIIILSNRASWLGVIVISITAIFLILVSGKFALSSKSGKLLIANVIVIVFAGGLFLSAFADTASLKSHTLNSLDYTQGSTKDRFGLWTRTIKLIEEKPVLGGGLGSWKINMLKYGNEGLVSENNTTFYQRPHNDFLWVAAEQGIIGLFLYALLFIVILFSLIKTLLNRTDEKDFKQLLVIVSVTLVFIVFSVFSFPKERISHNILLFTSWGIFLNFLNKNGSKNYQKIIHIKAGYYSTLVILILLLIIGVLRMNGEIHTQKAILAKKESKFQKCIHEIAKAESFCYQIDETSTPLKWYSGLSYFNLKNYEKAIEQFESAIRVNPYHIYSLSDYASSLAKTNQDEKAILFYNKAIAIAPNFLDPKLNLCALYFKEGKYSEAFEILKTTDVETNSERYKKTVTVIIQKIIENELKTKQRDERFLYLYRTQHDNYNFYKKLLSNAKNSDIHADELIVRSEHIFSKF